MSKTVRLYENDDFESWTDDSSEPLIFIHILDRGLTLSFCQKQWFEFIHSIKNTDKTWVKVWKKKYEGLEK